MDEYESVKSLQRECQVPRCFYTANVTNCSVRSRSDTAANPNVYA
jgi:hypothetical protein